jgi:hypothetical protein
MVRKRSPQEKKRLSYDRDRRNTYGENAKSSRKNIARSKARSHREYRSNVRTAIASSDLDDPDTLEDRVRSVRRESWVKQPDDPLGRVVEMKATKRKRMYGAKKKRRAASGGP